MSKELLAVIVTAAVCYFLGLLNGGIHITVETRTDNRPERSYSYDYYSPSDTYTPSKYGTYTPEIEEE